MHADYGYAEEEKLGKPYDLELLKQLYPFTAPYRFLLVLSVFLVILITFSDLLIPYITKIAIDQYIVPQIHSSEHSGETTISSNNQDKTRYLKADAESPDIRRIVHKYPHLFRQDGNAAFISLDDLSRLEKQEIIQLRQGNIRGLGFIALIFISVIILDFVLNFSQVMLMEYTGQMIMHDLRMQLFSHVHTLSVSFFNHNPVGRLVTRVTNDIQNMNELFTSVIVFVFKDLFLLIGIAVVLLITNWRLALISFSILPFVLYASLYFSNQARDAFRTMRVKIAEINTRFSETIGGIKVIQLFLQERQNYQTLKKLNHEYYEAGMMQVRVFAVFMPVIELLESVVVAMVIFYGGRSVMAETISLGELVVFISYMRMFFRPIRDIAEKYNIMQNAMASAERIFLILDNTEKEKSNGKSVENFWSRRADTLMTAENVFFGYVAGENVLKDISFELGYGRTMAVVGTTGSGKTSLINLIIRFYDPISGKILINGQDIRNWDMSVLRSKIAMVTQDPFLFTGTIRQNIFQADNVPEETIAQVLEASHCKSFTQRLPNGIDTELSEGGASISSGERQLISIARALARDPELIILDEATSYIDSETEALIQQALSNLLQNRTAIIVAHRLSTARHADMILVLNKGRIIESGRHDDLMMKKGFYFRLNQL